MLKFQLIANGTIGNMVSVQKHVGEDTELTTEQKESKKPLVGFVMESQQQLRIVTRLVVLVQTFHNFIV